MSAVKKRALLAFQNSMPLGEAKAWLEELSENRGFISGGMCRLAGVGYYKVHALFKAEKVPECAAQHRYVETVHYCVPRRPKAKKAKQPNFDNLPEYKVDRG